MLKLVEKYSKFTENHSVGNSADTLPAMRDHREVVVITGVTGSLGAHTLNLLRSDAAVKKIYCLVRGSDNHAALQRVRKALEQRQLASIDEHDPKLTFRASKLRQDDLGLDTATYDHILEDASTIMHLA